MYALTLAFTVKLTTKSQILISEDAKDYYFNLDVASVSVNLSTCQRSILLRSVLFKHFQQSNALKAHSLTVVMRLQFTYSAEKSLKEEVQCKQFEFKI